MVHSQLFAIWTLTMIYFNTIFTKDITIDTWIHNNHVYATVMMP